MKRNRKSFGRKLWAGFVLFSAVIFGALWLLQTVLLQRSYDSMVIRNVERVAGEILRQRDSQELTGLLTDYAASDSLLIFLTDWSGNMLFSTDEHSAVYQEGQLHSSAGDGQENPYRNDLEPMNWQIGVFRNLPTDYSGFLERLSASGDGAVGYRTEQGDTYIYGADMSSGTGEMVLYISTPLGAVGAAASILRVQLLWVTLASLLLGFLISFFIARQFSKPVASITAQAQSLARGNFQGDYKKGFCREMDELSDTLSRTAAELERLENARRELLANVSHDLRTPLTMIKGYAEMVRDISWSDDAQREADLSIIIREADRLTDLVNDILDYSALQSANTPPPSAPFDLSAAAQATADQFVPLCRQQGRTLEAHIQPGLWVNGSQEQLQRVLYNLLDNALSHTGDSQTVQLTLVQQGAAVRVEVQDHGTGIPAEELPYIWNRYFTARQRRCRGSSGLGLAITKEILTQHRADFGVESQLGQGCLFWFVLERAEGAAPPQAGLPAH